MLVITVSTAIFILEYGCGGHENGALAVYRFPADVGNSWDYLRTMYTVVYDTVNNDTTDYLSIDSLREEIENIDTIAGWHCYRLRNDYHSRTQWYAHPDTAFLLIAQSGSSDIKYATVPNMHARLKYNGLTFDSPYELIRYLDCKRNVVSLISRSDTFYYSPPYKVYVYPLRVGTHWVKMTDPWLEERTVVGADSTAVQAGTFFTLKINITSDWMNETDLWYNWISDHGLVKDSLHIRGVAWNDTAGVIGYFDVDDVYELYEFQVGE